MNFSQYYHFAHEIEPNTIYPIPINNEVRFFNSSFILFFSFVYSLMLSIMFHFQFPNYHSFFCYDEEMPEDDKRERKINYQDNDEDENESDYNSCFSLLSLTKYNTLQMYEHKYKMEMLKYLISSSSSTSSLIETTCENRMIMELTPLGNVVLKYDDKTKKFIYYSDHIIPYRFLQTVARAYALRFSCFHIFQEDWVQDKKEKGKENEKEKNENWILFSFFPFMKQEVLFDDIYHFNEVYSQAKGKHESILKEEEEKENEDEDEDEDEDAEENDEDDERKKETMIEEENKKNKMVNHSDTSKLFAKFKSYNNKTSIATANSMFSSPGQHRSDCEFTSSRKTKEKKKEITLNQSNQIEKSINMFSYQGKLVNFSFLQKIPLKKVDKIKSMNFSDFKKLKLQLPSTCTIIKEKK